MTVRRKIELLSPAKNADIGMEAINHGADAVYIASAPLIAMGCHMCQTCNTGKCNWGIATQRPDLTRRLNPEIAHQRVENLLSAARDCCSLLLF